MLLNFLTWCDASQVLRRSASRTDSKCYGLAVVSHKPVFRPILRHDELSRTGGSHRLYWRGVSSAVLWRAVLEGCHPDWQCSGGSHRLYWRAVSSAVLECLPWRGHQSGLQWREMIMVLFANNKKRILSHARHQFQNLCTMAADAATCTRHQNL